MPINISVHYTINYEKIIIKKKQIMSHNQRFFVDYVKVYNSNVNRTNWVITDLCKKKKYNTRRS